MNPSHLAIIENADWDGLATPSQIANQENYLDINISLRMILAFAEDYTAIISQFAILSLWESRYAALYMFTNFQASYYIKNAAPMVFKNQYKEHLPLIIIDCSKQNEIHMSEK